uniref:Uncharacterized protein n=1 Tax=Janibacter limosus TaxID=53458 RepID=A0AC61U681_9MICO|nr:hypothetical protein [Janibacter limosus]
MSEASLGMDMDVPQRNLEAALELLTECLSEPVFAETEVARADAHPAGRDRAGAGLGRAPGAEGVGQDLLRREQQGEPPGLRDAGDGRRDHPPGRRGLPRAARPPRGGATVVVAGDLTGVDVDALLAGSLGARTTSRADRLGGAGPRAASR